MPRYVIDESAVLRNLEILKSVSDRTGVKILLAQKAFSCTALYPLCAKYLAGTTASSLFEARHGHDNFGGQTHVFAPAFVPEEMDELLGLVDHVVFNSPRQTELYGAKARSLGVSVGLRVNPETPVATTPAYDPCRPGSRLGVVRRVLDADAGVLDLVSGLHFHCLCEQGVDELREVLEGFEVRFGDLLHRMQWVNFGGGHHITRKGYDVDALVALLNDFRARYPHLEVFLEPGEAVALDAGTLESRVLEVQPRAEDGVSNVILDVSAACHMPDVLEMPYTPRITGAVTGGSEKPYVYRFGGPTCLAGDVIGVYGFDGKLSEGDVVRFEDMAIYTMVKNNTFNGVNLPDIVVRRPDGTERTVRRFGYGDFASRI